MNTPLSWIKAYVPELDCTAQEYTDAMTLTGTKVEGFERLDAGLDKIVVGKILKIERHPDATKLIVCEVQIGKDGETTQIVTGAPNVKEGDIIPVVLDGGRVACNHDGEKVAGGVKIKKGKLRGIESNGMMCSIDELGSSREFYPEAPENGVYVFNANPEYDGIEIGSDAVEALGLRDVTFEYEITSNRVDCFGVTGIAREAAATFGKKFVPPIIKETGNSENASDYISVEVKDADLCKRYVGRVVKNVKIGPSPLWMQRRLSACGIRPINNLVDITNYVMEEMAQPMHAYNLDDIAGKKIIVRRANDGEEFVTLDGMTRKVDSSVLMICDAEKAVGIAGIMGGENSKVTDDVNTILLEAACFDGTNIRLSSKKVGLRTDASGKFEKGLDPNNAIIAMNRACQLIEELGAGEVVGGCVDIYPEVKEEGRVKFSYERTNKVLGTSLDKETMISYFKAIDLGYDYDTDEVIVPTWRQDVNLQADLDEEVARFFGYENIPTTLPSGQATAGKLSFKLRMEGFARDLAEQFGFSEAQTYSFESPKVFDKLLLSADDQLRNTVVISNPLGEDYSVMRTLPLNGMLSSLSTNYNRRNKDVRLYELANVYIPGESKDVLPDERMQFTLGFYGAGDFFDLKGVVEEFFEKIGMKGITTYDPKAGKNFLHPGRQANIVYEGTVIGYLGEVHPEVLDNYNIGDRAYVAVLDMPEIVARANFDLKYTGIAKYPAVSRDISMVMTKDILAGQVEEVIRKNAGKILESYKLFDVYEGAQIKEGYKSMAYNITFRAADRTLEEADITNAMTKILNGLSALGIELRQ
ncbi:MAG: phenylalanine--tRNA ligase subunit beta [Lachnospiraceae bacterium]|nr:phenylalanine--tRNA ligase subunit beta [Lachnospiraceae bacterium]